MSEPAQPLQYEEGDIFWAGQTIQDGAGGQIAFGQDSKGALHVKVIGRTRDGNLHELRGIFPDGKVLVEFLYEWFVQKTAEPLPTKIAHAEPDSWNL